GRPFRTPRCSCCSRFSACLRSGSGSSACGCAHRCASATTRRARPACRMRQRGTPISYALSNVLGEIVLFVMDLAVNQRADGLYLYRIHDDLWMWDKDPERCARAWRELQRYAQLVGLTFNEAKTGAVCIGEAHPPDLPKGDVRWNFLRFDAEKEARFVIDQDMVSAHIEELRRQLAAT